MTAKTTAVQDTWTLAVRMLKHNIRSIDTIMTVVAMPVTILLAFVFVLGGAMDTGPIRYVDYVVPVVLLMCVGSGVAYSAFRVNTDILNGIHARLRTLPIARFAILGGHIAASVLANAATLVIVLGVAWGIGYRPKATVAGWAVTTGLLAAVLIAFSVMGVAFGAIAKTNEGSGLFSYLLLALLFVSSGFAPTDTMSAPLRAFADHQPLTPIITAIRDAQLGAVNVPDTLLAFGWLAAMALGFGVLAATLGKRGTARSL